MLQDKQTERGPPPLTFVPQAFLRIRKSQHSISSTRSNPISPHRHYLSSSQPSLDLILTRTTKPHHISSSSVTRPHHHTRPHRSLDLAPPALSPSFTLPRNNRRRSRHLLHSLLHSTTVLDFAISSFSTLDGYSTAPPFTSPEASPPHRRLLTTRPQLDLSVLHLHLHLLDFAGASRRSSFAYSLTVSRFTRPLHTSPQHLRRSFSPLSVLPSSPFTRPPDRLHHLSTIHHSLDLAIHCASIRLFTRLLLKPPPSSLNSPFTRPFHSTAYLTGLVCVFI